jgi:hypothetical protein
VVTLHRFVFVLVVAGILIARLGAAEWNPHVVRQLNGAAAEIRILAKQQIVTEQWNRVVAVPNIVYMSEKDRLLMLVSCDYPHAAWVMTSNDRGVTWSDLRPLHCDARGKPVGGLGVSLTYLGQGKVFACSGPGSFMSQDYGTTWGDPLPASPAPDGTPWPTWDPLFVQRDDKTAAVPRLVGPAFKISGPGGKPYGGIVLGYLSESYLHSSADEGRTWSKYVLVPQWKRASEIAILRAANGDWVAACRMDVPVRFLGPDPVIDHYEGLGVSISKDRGATWSEIKMLYDWGRHHPSLVLMPNHDIVMTYVVRKGYVDTADGFPQFGIEAVVSHDNGQNWDLDHRYLLHTWAGNRKQSPNAWWASSQATSSVLLPGDFLLTAYGTGYRAQDVNGSPAPRDAGLVLWQLGDQPLNDDRAIRDAPFDSDVRNLVDPATGKHGSAPEASKALDIRPKDGPN